MTLPKDGRFRKSSQSNVDPVPFCVEVARTEESILVRNSRHPDAEPQQHTEGEWSAFIAGVKSGEFDL